MKNPEIPAEDAELEALMAELEAQNAEIAASAAVAPAPVAEAPAASNPPVATVPAPVEQVAVAAASAQSVSVAPVEAPVATTPTPKDELAALEAELAASQDAAPEPVVAPPAPAPAEVPVSAPVAPVAVAVAPAPTPAAVAERRVILNEDGSVKQPALGAAGPFPFDAKNTAVFGAGSPAEDTMPLPTPTPTAPKKPPLNYYVDVDQFRRDTRVTEATLDSAMFEQSGLRAYYGTMAANAEAQAARMKAKFEVVEATLYDHHRKQMAASGEKTTEKMVENAVRLDPRWINAKNLLIESETIASINKCLVESLKDRRDMIIQLGADRRDEYKGAARVLAEQQDRDDIRARAIAAGRVAQSA